MSEHVEFGILGPLSASRGGRAIPLGPGKHRALLACLLVRANQVVPVDELVDRLWGEDPPAGGRRVLQTYITRLRKALGEAGELVRTRPPGYLLEVPELALDVAVFRAHVERARQARAAGDPHTEADELRSALALWRGEPLSDISSDWLRRDEVPRLVEERMQALDRRIEADLALGRHAELVSELYGLTREHPLRESLWGQLMLALSRSDRQADALQAFRDVSGILREELGLDPGDRLRAIHQVVLNSDVRVPAQLDARSTIRQLPGDVSDFVGRQELIRRIDALVDGSGSPIVTLSGPPGIGKTALAVHVAHRLTARFPDGQLYLNLRGHSTGSPMAAGDALARFLRALGVPPDKIPTEVDEQSSLFRSTVSGRHILMVLDNAASPDQVRPLLPGGPSIAVIVTSRDELRGLTAIDGARRVPVDVLSEDESLALLASIAGQAVVTAELTAAQQLAAACGHLPLALRIAAANLAGGPHRTVEAYVGDLLAGDRLRMLEISGDDRSAVRVAFGLSYEALNTEQARLFRLLGLIPGPDFDAHAAAKLADQTLSRAHSLLDGLATANLIQHDGSGRYQFHDLIRAYATALCDEHDHAHHRDAAYLRLMTFYATTVDAVAGRLYPEWLRLPVPSTLDGPGRDDLLTGAEQLAWLDEERANLVAAAGQPRAGAEHLVCPLAAGLLGYFGAHRHDRDWRATFTTGLAIATRADDLPAQAVMHFGLGMLQFAMADLAAVRESWERALELYRRHGDRLGEARMMSSLGTVSLSVGDRDGVAREFEQALAIQREIGDGVGEALSVMRIGLTHLENGPLPVAVELLSRAQSLSRELRFRTYAVSSTLFLGLARLFSGNPAEAIGDFETTAALCTEFRYAEGHADAYNGLALACIALGRPDEACQHAERAVELSRTVSAHQTEISTLVTLGTAHVDAGRIAEGMTCLLHGLELAEKLEYPFDVRRAEVYLAACYRHRGEYELAVRTATDAASSPFAPWRGQANAELGRIRLAQGDPGLAVEHAREGLAISRECGYVVDEAHALWVLGDALGARGDRDEAEVCLRQAAEMFAGMRSRHAARVRPA